MTIPEGLSVTGAGPGMPPPPPQPPPRPPVAVDPQGSDSPGAEGSGSMRWFERRGIRIASIVGLVVGVMLLGVGIFGLVSMANTNSDSQATKDQVTALREETDALNQQREAAIADAEAAVSKAAALGMKTSNVEAAVLTVHEATHETVAEGNVLADCGSVVDEAAFMACTNNAVESFNVALTAEINAVADLRTEITQLEEAMQ